MIVRRDPRRLLLAIAIVALAGTTVFGLWHLLVGGLVNGNSRAAAFGAVLASMAGTALAVVIVAVHRRGRRARL